jgi:hypothetical protein
MPPSILYNFVRSGEELCLVWDNAKKFQGALQVSCGFPPIMVLLSIGCEVYPYGET